jgi:Zn-dependent peptidase ImmA (M78 family)
VDQNKILARQALRTALETRRSAGIERNRPVCIFDLAERLGIEVRFRPEKSLEGMYVRSSSGLILVSAYRPPGRQAFTCAHELGHHVFGHGTKVDEYIEASNKDQHEREEIIANLFAAYILMPSAVVSHAFLSRGWGVEFPSDIQVYEVSCYLGVGYETLVNHMCWSLELITPEHRRLLLKSTPKSIQHQLIGCPCEGEVLAVQSSWLGRAIDIQVGSVILLPFRVQIEGASIVICPRSGEFAYKGARPGISRIESACQGWSAFVRVSRKNYIGRSTFRHLEDPDENGTAANSQL